MQPRRQRGPGLGLLLLGTQMFQVGLDRIPPVTLIAIIAQVVTYLRPAEIDLPSISDVCVSAAYVWHYGDWKRCLFAAFFHLDDWHLYYNMVSFLWKGLTLERYYGSAYFAFLIAVFSVLTNVVLVALNVLIGEYLLNDRWYTMQCAAGFSGVIFALKVLSTARMPSGIQYIMGWLPVPSRYAVWAELVIIQILVPRASFTGHLAGILVGLLYEKGPLGLIMEGFFSMFTGFSVGGRRPAPSGQRPYYNQSGTTGRRPNGGPDMGYQQRPEPTAPPAYEVIYPNRGQQRVYPDLNEANLPYPPEDNPGMPSPGVAPDVERMRRSRLNRFEMRE